MGLGRFRDVYDDTTGKSITVLQLRQRQVPAAQDLAVIVNITNGTMLQ